MVLPHLLSKLPQDVQSRWKDRCAKLTEEPTSQIFLNCLAEQARHAVNSKPSTSVGKTSSSTHKNTLSGSDLIPIATMLQRSIRRCSQLVQSAWVIIELLLVHSF
ncbi:Ice nucleation protein [Trichinella pseudospiralis]